MSSEPDHSDQHRWFAEEVYLHDGPLKSYLRGTFPAVRDVDDVVQESYLHVWTAHRRHPILAAKAFLFTVARNIAFNLLRHQRVSPLISVTDLEALPVLEDGPNVADAACTREEIEILVAAIEALPARCREIFILRRLKGVPQKEIAARLGISEETVQVQVQRGLARCAIFLRRRGVKGSRHGAQR